MNANSVSFSPLAIARAKFVVVGTPGSLIRRIADSACSLKDSEHVSVDRLLNEEVVRKSPAGIAGGKVRASGADAPAHVVLPLLRRWFWSRKTSRGFVLSGFPANPVQAVLFDEWLDERDETLTACVWISQSEDDALREACETRVCAIDGSVYVNGIDAQLIPGHCNLCRSELVSMGDVAVARVRNWYRRSFEDARRVAEYYRERGLLHSMDATTPVEDAVEALGRLVSDR